MHHGGLWCRPEYVCVLIVGTLVEALEVGTTGSPEEVEEVVASHLIAMAEGVMQVGVEEAVLEEVVEVWTGGESDNTLWHVWHV